MGSPLVPGAFAAAALFNVLYLKGMALYFEPDAFSAVLSSIGLLLGAMYPALALQATSAADALALVQARRESRLAARFDRLARFIVLAALPLAGLAFFATSLQEFFRFPRPSFAALAPLLAAGSLLHCIGAGLLLGAGQERAFAFVIALEPVVRSAAAIAFVRLGLGDFGPLLAIVFATTAMATVARALLPRTDSGTASPIAALPRRSALDALKAPTALLALFALGTIATADVPFTRAVLPAELAGRYAALAAAGRFLLLLPVPLAIVLIARIGRDAARNRPTLRPFLKALLLLAAALGGALVLLFLLGAEYLAVVLDGERYGDLAPELLRYGFAAAALALASLLVFYGIALGRVSLALVPAAALPAYVALLARHGHTLAGCLSVLQLVAGAVAAVAAVVVLLPLVWVRRAPERLPRGR